MAPKVEIPSNGQAMCSDVVMIRNVTQPVLSGVYSGNLKKHGFHRQHGTAPVRERLLSKNITMLRMDIIIDL